MGPQNSLSTVQLVRYLELGLALQLWPLVWSGVIVQIEGVWSCELGRLLNLVLFVGKLLYLVLEPIQELVVSLLMLDLLDLKDV